MREFILRNGRRVKWGKSGSSLKGSAPPPRASTPSPEYFVPPGHVPLLKAIYDLARSKNPAIWSDLKPDEAAIYDGLGLTHDLNEVSVDPGERESASGKRWTELCAAGNALRNAMAAEELQAIEHRRMNGDLRQIDAQFWTSDAAAGVFVTGARQWVYRIEEYEARILLSAQQFATWLKRQPKSQKAGRLGRPPADMQLILETAKGLIRKDDVADTKKAFAQKVIRHAYGTGAEAPAWTTVTNKKDFTELCRKAGITSRTRAQK
jgi:hypothetical protein